MTDPVVLGQLAAVLNDGGHRTHYAERTAADLLPVVRRIAADEIRAAVTALCRGEDEFPAIHNARCVPLLAYADQVEAATEESTCLAS